MPFSQNAGQKVNFLFALVAVLYLVLLTVDFARYGVVAPSWITAAFAIALGGWIGCRRSDRLRGAARFCGTRRCVRRRADCAVLRRRPGRFRVRCARKAGAGISRHVVGLFRHDGYDGARKRIRAQGLCIHATQRRRGARVFRPRIRRIFRIGAVKTGHPMKIRMPGFFFMPVTVGAPPVPSPAWRDTRAMPVQPRTLSPAPAQSARQASAAAPPAPAPSAGSPPAGSMR